MKLNHFSITILLFFLVLILNSCSKEAEYTLTDGFCIEFEDGAIINHNDIDYYDASSHIVYLKGDNSLLSRYNHGSIFKIYANKEIIYTGSFYSAFSSLIPLGPFIYETSFPEYPNFIVSIDFLPALYNSNQQTIDPRTDERIHMALSKYNNLRKGISCNIKSLNVSVDNSVTLEIELTNLDEENYYIFDPDKMGINLFHFYTNGLTLTDSENRRYTHSVVSTPPSSIYEWNLSWFTILESGASKTFTLVYDDFAPLTSGQYIAYFTFPSLLVGINRSDLQQDNGRLWLGELRVSENITIE